MTGKTFAALLLGLPLAVALTGLVALLAPGTVEARTLPVLLFFVPVWVATASAAFAFRSGRSAWSWMLGANALAFAALWAVKASGVAGLPA